MNIIGVGGSISFSGVIGARLPPTIECESVFSGILELPVHTPSGIYFSNFSSVSISNLAFENCVVYSWQDGDISIDRVIFNSFLDIRNVNFVSITSTIGTGLCDALRNDVYGVFNFNFTKYVEFTNVTLSTELLQCINDLKMISFNTGHLVLNETTFTGPASHIVLRNCTVDTLGKVNFKNGRTAIQALSSIVTLAGYSSFINNTGYQGGGLSLTDSRITIADNAQVLFKENHAEFVGGAIFDSGNGISDYVSKAQTIGLPRLSLATFPLV